MSKHGWTYKKLTDVSEIQYGFAFDSNYFCEDNSYPQLIRIRDVVRGFSETFFRGEVPDNYWVNKGEYLIGMDGEFNIAPWQSDRALLNQRVCKITSKNSDCLIRFIYYNMQSILKAIEDETPFVTVKHLSAKKLNAVKLPVPGMAEQEAIVAELDEINEAIAALQQQVADLDTLAQSTFYDMFGDPVTNPKAWPVKPMGEVGELHRGSGLSKKDLIENGFPCILYGQIHTKFGAYTTSHLTCIPQQLVETAKIAKYGDILMAITSEDVEGSCKSVAWMGDYEIAIGSDAAIYRHKLNPIFVSYYTQTSAFFAEKSKYAKGFKVTHISTKEIGKIPIFIPPLALQQEFAAKVEAIESAKAELNAQIAEMQTLLASRMDYYFE